MVRVVNDEPAGTWPRSMPGIGRTLTVEQELACALRILAARGLAGEPVGPHHRGATDDGGMW